MKLGTIYDITFSTNRADTGALSSADSTPVVRVTENGVNLAYLPTVSTISTGVYLVSIDTAWANGFEVWKRYSVYCTATVNAIDWATGLDSFTVETRSIDDILPTSWYTAPDNATLATLPTLAEIEASTILAKEATIPTVWEIRTELSPELLLITTNLDAKVSEAGWTGGWLTTEEHTKLFSLENSTGGGGFSSQAIQTSISNAKKAIMDRIDEIKPTDLSGIENTLNEISSQNDIAKWEIIDTIKQESIEVSSDIIRKSKDLEESNVKTRNLVRQKTEKIDKNVSKLSDRQDLTDKAIEDQAEEIESELERIYEQESDMIENEINAQFEKEAQDIETELNQ